MAFSSVALRLTEPIVVLADRIDRRLTASRQPIVVWFDEDCGLCGSVVRLLRPHAHWSVQFKPNHELTDPLLMARADQAIIVQTPTDTFEGVPAVAALLGWCGPVGVVACDVMVLPGIRDVAAVVYGQVAKNRSRISSRLGLKASCDLLKSTS